MSRDIDRKRDRGNSIAKIILYPTIFFVVQQTIFQMYFVFEIINYIAINVAREIQTGIDDAVYAPMRFNFSLFILIFCIVTLVIIYKAIKKKGVEELSIRKMSVDNTVIVLLIGTSMNILVVIAYVTFMMGGYLPGRYEDYEYTAYIVDSSTFFLTILSTGIAIPILEEVVFRGIVYNEMKKITTPMKAIIIQAVIFGVAHGNLFQGIHTFILAIVMAIAYDKTKSLNSAILIHIAYNITATTMVYRVSGDFLELMLIPLVAVAVVVVVATLVYILWIENPDTQDGYYRGYHEPDRGYFDHTEELGGYHGDIYATYRKTDNDREKEGRYINNPNNDYMNDTYRPDNYFADYYERNNHERNKYDRDNYERDTYWND